MSEPLKFRLANALQAFIDENGIKKSIDIDHEEQQSYLFFSSTTDLGEVQCGIHTAEADAYVMVYLINGQKRIPKSKRNKILEKINQINISTKIGCFQLFNYEDGEYIRFYLGFPADDVDVDATVIYNLLAECIRTYETSAHELIDF